MNQLDTNSVDVNPGDNSRLERFAMWLGDGISRRPWTAIVLSLALVVGTGFGAKHLEFSNNYRVFFGPANPELTTFEHFQSTYTKNDNIMFVVKPSAGTVFTSNVTDALERITEEAWKIPYAIRVDSITNFQHSSAEGDDLTVEDLVRRGAEQLPGAPAIHAHRSHSPPPRRSRLIGRTRRRSC